MEISYVNRTLWQLALRRWAEVFRSPFLYAAFVGMVIGITVAGPAGVFTEFPFFRRFGFSVAVNSVSWAIGIFFTPLIRIALELRGVHRSIAAFAGISLSMAMILPVFYYLLMWEFQSLDLPSSRLFETLFALALLIVVLAFGFMNPMEKVETLESYQRQKSNSAETAPTQVEDEPFNCIIQAKLPADKRGELYAMVAQDHYVEVITDKGSELVLMRLSDAMDLCDSDGAIQIHRSAWVTRKGLVDVKKDGRKLTVILPDGRGLPVARSSESDVRDFAKRFHDINV